jgi:aldehyde dehydrogenase (NAD+)
MTDHVGAGEARMLIGGELVEAASGKRFENINPATEEVLGEVADASAADMQRAIASARQAFDESDWSTNRALRKRCLEQLQEALESEREAYREELIAEVGTPRMMTYAAQLDWPLEEALRWPAKMIDEFSWDRGLPDGNLMGIHSRRAVWKEPIGVIGAIVPWNYPLEVTLNKLGPILATGNTVIIKPAPDTPWNATRLGRLVAEKTDIPPGVVNVVTSADHLVGEELTVSPLVDMISFTGSTMTGSRIMEKGAPTLKKTFLELGGKSAMIVLDDADFATSVPGASMVCVHGGQGCAMQTRMLLPRSRYDEGVELISAAMTVVPYGDPNSDAVVMGPLVSARQRDRVLGYIERGQEEGAKLVVGGDRPAHLPKGWYVEPTLFVDVDNSMTIAQEEIFGPVLAVIPYEDDDDAVRIANESSYGLSGGIVSASEERATALARRVRTGSMSVNGGMWYGADSPYGGYKASGVGRQCGVEGLEQYLETKAIAWPQSG